MGANLAITGSECQEKVLDSPVPVLVDFWAEWCGPCKAIGPAVEQVAAEYADKARVFKLDVDSDSDIAGQYGVMSIPALFVFKAVTAWAVPPMKGAEGKRSTAGLIVLPASFYDVNTWDLEASPERTRRNWRSGIHKRLEQIEEAAVIHATEIFDQEQIFVDAA